MVSIIETCQLQLWKFVQLDCCGSSGPLAAILVCDVILGAPQTNNQCVWSNINHELTGTYQQVGFLCFVLFVCKQWGVTASTVDHNAKISHLWVMCPAAQHGWGKDLGVPAWFGSQGSIVLNWHSRYSGMCYSSTWLYWPSCPMILYCFSTSRVEVLLSPQ